MNILVWLWNNWFLGGIIAAILTLNPLCNNNFNSKLIVFEILIRVALSIIFSWILIFIIVMLKIFTFFAVEASDEYNELEQEQKINEVKNE